MDNKTHHEKLDELIDSARDTMHDMLNSAILSDALTPGMADPDKYLLAKAIITIWGDQQNYAPPDPILKRDIKNLACFV